MAVDSGKREIRFENSISETGNSGGWHFKSCLGFTCYLPEVQVPLEKGFLRGKWIP